jgi:hypothetical protein
MKKLLSLLLMTSWLLSWQQASVNSQTAETLPERQGIRMNGVVVYATPYATGRATAEGFFRVLGFNGATLETALINDVTGVYVAYGLLVEPQSDPRLLKVTIKPPTTAAINNLRKSIWVKKMAERFPNLDQNKYAPQALPSYPPPSVINITDTVKLTLWKNDETGATIGEQFRFEPDRPLPAEDFTLNQVMLKLNDFRLFINGEIRSGEEPLGGFASALPWFYMPGKGRFIFSLQPHAGYDFKKIAVLEGHKISFSYDGDSYEWNNGDSILGQGGKWHLWVLYDRDFMGDEKRLKDMQLISKGNCCLYGALGHVSLLPSAKR